MMCRRSGERGVRYAFLERECIRAKCWAPGHYQHRGATGDGSRNTGDPSACCMRRAYHGCPDDSEREYDVALSKLRRSEGWKPA